VAERGSIRARRLIVQELPKPPWYVRVRVWMIVLPVLVVLVAACGVLAWQGRQKTAHATTTTVPARRAERDESDLARLQTTRSAPPTTRPKPGVLWRKTGRDLHVGALFRAPDRWRIIWSFDCRSFAPHGGGNFKITSEGDIGDVLVQRFAAKAKGTQLMTGGGWGRLVIDSVCDSWTVQAVAA
jgi:hypothetical protein